MIINNTLHQAILRQADGADLSGIAGDAKNLSLRYRTNRQKNENLIMNENEVLAYAFTRMPATYGAVLSALEQTAHAFSAPPGSVLDVGAGTGAAAWAAAACFGETDILCFEREERMLGLGKRIMACAQDQFPRTVWVRGDVTADKIPHKADLVIAAYMLNEMSPDVRRAVVEKLWAATDQVLLIVEPGTPAGFSVLGAIRAQMLGSGAHIAAPCTHEGVCPISGSDWCHFSARIPRSHLHRRLKEGDVPYEDEKFSYLAFSRSPQPLEGARVLRHPQINKGHITLDLCGRDGIVQSTISKKDGEHYKRARKLHVGDRM